MNDDRSLERAARSWLEEGPTWAPDRPVEAALSRIQTTRQERDLRISWRLPTMLPTRYAAVAVIVVAVGVGAAFLASRPPAGPAAQTAAPSATAAPPSAAPARSIANGRYRASIPVAGILSRLASDATLTAEEKAIVTGSVLYLDGATTLRVQLRFDDTTFLLVFDTDTGTNGGLPVPWPMQFLDPNTIVLDVGATGDNIQAYAVHWIGNAFTLQPRSAAPTAVEAFVRSTLYESVPFVREH